MKALRSYKHELVLVEEPATFAHPLEAVVRAWDGLSWGRRRHVPAAELADVRDGDPRLVEIFAAQWTAPRAQVSP